jgi:O-antigen ligase
MKYFSIRNLKGFNYNYVLCILFVLYSFFLPFRNNISSVISVLILLLYIFNYRELKSKFLLFLGNRFAVLFSLLYVVHLIGLIYTSNLKFALTDLEIKLPLLFFPIIITSDWIVLRKHLNTLLFSFIIGCLGASTISITNSLFDYLRTNDLDSFFYDRVSFLMHSSYYAMYLCFAIIISIYLFRQTNNKVRYFLPFLILLFLTNIILLSSRAGLLMLAITFLMSLLFIIYKRKFRYLIIVSFVLFSSVYIVYNFAPATMQRIEILNPLSMLKSDTSKVDDINNRDTRLVLAEMSFVIISSNPILGVGTGDVKDALINQYKINNFKLGITQKLNSHNQYLQFLVTFGIVGFLIFIISMYYPFIFQLKIKNWLFIYFIVLVSINFLFESILETKAGVEFYAFFSILILLAADKKVID